ncbi:hypothetical protein [Stenotrophomonas sp. NPDC078853]|uniref:hypothetical protein n=1 Tax=Stenotrophomonas sp. NPDC078853 TaxID=3364534 RepID=UPI0038509D59
MSEYNADDAREDRDASRGSHEELLKFLEGRVRERAKLGLSSYVMGRLPKYPEATYAAVAIELQQRGFVVTVSDQTVTVNW